MAHLACHGRLRADNPTSSELELSGGSLLVHELDRHGVAPHRIVLAACEAAAEQAYEGDELVGFVSALLARGTRAPSVRPDDSGRARAWVRGSAARSHGE